MQRGKRKDNRGQRGSQSLSSLMERGGRKPTPNPQGIPHTRRDIQRYPPPPPPYDEVYARTRNLSIDERLYPNPPPYYPRVDDSPYGHSPMYHPGPLGPRPYSEIPRHVPVKGTHESKPSQGQLSVQSLVKALIQMKDCWSTATTLGRLVEHPSKTVVKLVKKHPDIFGYMKNEADNDTQIELRPQLLVCEQFVQSSCKSPGECFHLHLCKFFALNTCKRGVTCNYGHSWKTDHNMKVLKKFYLHEINGDSIQELVKKSVGGSLVPRICAFYNGTGCRKPDMECSALHICHAYVYSNRLCKATCLLGHDIFARHCVRLLNKYEISTNEAARDIFQKLNPGPPPTPKNKKPESSKNRTKAARESSESSDTSSTSDDSSEDENENSKKIQRKKRRSKAEGKTPDIIPDKSQKRREQGNDNSKKKDGKVKGKVLDKTNIKTLYSYNLCGDVPIPEICTYSLVNKCFNEKKGCQRLHSKHSVQWQVQINNSWYNLRAFQGKILEDAYRDVNQDGVTLPPPDPSKIDKETQELMGLLGTSDLKVDFQEMTMQKDSNENFCIRRLTSFSKTGNVVFFQWFFYDDQKWIKYGTVDSKGRTDLVSNITSDDIERTYLKDCNQTIQFKNEKFAYEVNFKRMSQRNVQTKTERPIRRRPLIQRNLGTKGSTDKNIPTTWEKMSDTEMYKIVPVTNSEERMSVLKMFRLTLPTVEVVSIERVQSPFLYKAFINKKRELFLKYNEEEINMQQLFHGTKPECVQDICKENFDWRLYGTSHGHSFGKGTYFSNSAATSITYCPADQNNQKIIFVAQVIIGKVTAGNSSYTRPPADFDTTVNNVAAPSIFVKYDKQEYYPEYIIKFKN